MTSKERGEADHPFCSFFLQEFSSRKTLSSAHFSSVKNLDAVQSQRPGPSYAVATSLLAAVDAPKPRDFSNPCTACDNSVVSTAMRSAIEANNCCS